MAVVRNSRRDPLDVDTMIRIFNRKVERDGTMEDMRKHNEYLSPSEKRRAKDAKAAARRRQKQRIAARFTKD